MLQRGISLALPASLRRFLLRGTLLSCDSPLQNAFRPLELGAASRSEVLSAAIDEVLNHPDAGPETTRRHILACHCPRNLGGRACERLGRRMCGIRGDTPHPLSLLRSAFRRGRRHRVNRDQSYSIHSRTIGMWLRDSLTFLRGLRIHVAVSPINACAATRRTLRSRGRFRDWTDNLEWLVAVATHKLINGHSTPLFPRSYAFARLPEVELYDNQIPGKLLRRHGRDSTPQFT
jgi:hypothetical protein